MVRGKPPVEGETRSEVLKVRHTKALGASMDAARGAQTRADFAREAIRTEIRARGGSA